jgi:hypothetical protein
MIRTIHSCRRLLAGFRSRTVDLADLLIDVRDLLKVEELDAYLFGSRRFKTGSIRSDIDILLFLKRKNRSMSQAPGRARPTSGEETAHLLRVPANARRLIESLQQAVSGQREEHDLEQ